jgi:catechol 2,3-dioxygenase-like lactoylglutathione lyase family enzyme
MIDIAPTFGDDQTVRSRPLAVHSLDHFALLVPDLAVAERFYTTFGLKVENVADGLQIRAAQGTTTLLREAPQRRLDYMSFSIDADDLKAFQQRLEAGGIALLDPPLAAKADGLWFRDPDGVLVEIVARERRSPSSKSFMDVRISPEGVRRAQMEIGKKTVPRRLGHVLRFSPDVLRAVDFYSRFLGMRLSDRSGDIIAFMHSPRGSDHHVVAFAKSSRPGFHHASFEVESIDAIGMGATNMAHGGYGDGWGVGRHEAGSNFFYYVRDPWGSFAEYFCDIDYIPEGCAWEARDTPNEYALALWNPVVPGYFLENHEGSV